MQYTISFRADEIHYKVIETSANFAVQETMHYVPEVQLQTLFNSSTARKTT